MNTEIKTAYKNLFSNIESKGKKYKESDKKIVAFSALGTPGAPLMVVGRATNGWDICYDREKSKTNPLERNGSEWVIKELEKKTLSEVLEKWNTQKKYNIKRSQFWRVTRAITQTISPNQNLTESIIYTNLYKLAHSSGNLSQRLMNAIDNMCIEIFKAEVEYYKPKYILFLTGGDWAKPFLRGNDANINLDYQYVQAQGTFNGIPFVVAVHPQGKKEALVVSEIKNAFDL